MLRNPQIVVALLVVLFLLIFDLLFSRFCIPQVIERYPIEIWSNLVESGWPRHGWRCKWRLPDISSLLQPTRSVTASQKCMFAVSYVSGSKAHYPPRLVRIQCFAGCIITSDALSHCFPATGRLAFGPEPRSSHPFCHASEVSEAVHSCYPRRSPKEPAWILCAKPLSPPHQGLVSVLVDESVYSLPFTWLRAQ